MIVFLPCFKHIFRHTFINRIRILDFFAILVQSRNWVRSLDNGEHRNWTPSSPCCPGSHSRLLCYPNCEPNFCSVRVLQKKVKSSIRIRFMNVCLKMCLKHGRKTIIPSRKPSTP